MKIRFSEGIPKREHFYNEIIYPEEIADKRCGGCMRCQERDNLRGKDDVGLHCTMQNYWHDINADDKACVHYWDREREERIKAQEAEDIENRRKELWTIYADKEPVKLPIEYDGYGNIPICPICGEMPYSTEQCHWCGQRFIQDEDIKEYNKPWTEEKECPNCGAKVTVYKSKYNGHRHYHCDKCGCLMME